MFLCNLIWHKYIKNKNVYQIIVILNYLYVDLYFKSNNYE